jgi:hypothetical protein
MTISVGFALAVVVGVSLGVFGAGGSILTVPILVYVIGTEPVQATAYSLVVVGLTSAVGAAAYIRRREADLLSAALFAVPSVAAVYLTRRVLLPAIPDQLGEIGGVPIGRDLLLMLLFGIVMIWAASGMIRPGKQGAKRHEQGDVSQNRVTPTRVRWVPIVTEGAGVGVLTGLVGAGGGFLIVPVLVLAAGMPMRQAVGTSLIIIALKSLVGFLGDVGAGREIDWAFLALFSALAASGAIGGTILAARVSGERLRPWFGWFVMGAGVSIVAIELI